MVEGGGLLSRRACPGFTFQGYRGKLPLDVSIALRLRLTHHFDRDFWQRLLIKGD